MQVLFAFKDSGDNLFVMLKALVFYNQQNYKKIILSFFFYINPVFLFFANFAYWKSSILNYYGTIRLE